MSEVETGKPKRPRFIILIALAAIAIVLVAAAGVLVFGRGSAWFPGRQERFFRAIVAGDAAKVRRYLDAGCDVNERDFGPMTATSWAALKSRGKVAEILFMRWAAAGAPNADGLTPLHVAVISGRKEVAQFLISKGADVNAPDGEGETPLAWAVLSDVAMVTCLVDKGADLNWRGADGGTLLHHLSRLAARRGAADGQAARETAGERMRATNATRAVAAFLIDKGLDVNARDKSGMTPLHRAARHAFVELADLFITRGADIEAMDNEHKSPYDRSAHNPVGKLLRSCGAVAPPPPGRTYQCETTGKTFTVTSDELYVKAVAEAYPQKAGAVQCRFDDKFDAYLVYWCPNERKYFSFTRENEVEQVVKCPNGHVIPEEYGGKPVLDWDSYQ